MARLGGRTYLSSYWKRQSWTAESSHRWGLPSMPNTHSVDLQPPCPHSVPTARFLQMSFSVPTNYCSTFLCFALSRHLGGTEARLPVPVSVWVYHHLHISTCMLFPWDGLLLHLLTNSLWGVLGFQFVVTQSATDEMKKEKYRQCPFSHEHLLVSW